MGYCLNNVNPQILIYCPSDKLKMNQDGVLDHSNDTRRFDIVLKMVEDDIVRGMDEIDEIESNSDVTGSCHGIWCITCEN